MAQQAELVMIYSVYNYATRSYDYYRGGRASSTHAGVPPRARGRTGLGPTPEQAAWRLPPDAQKFGSGPQARGQVASLGGIADSVGYFGLGAAALAAIMIWKVL